MWRPSRGALDTSFDTDGWNATTFPAGSASANALVVQPSDQKLVLAGYVAGATEDLAIARFTANGALDTATFGAGTGRVSTDIGGADQRAVDVAVQPDGKILVLGWTTAATRDIVVARYSSTGVLDPTFGTGGIATFDVAGYDKPESILVQPSGRIVVSGTVDRLVDSLAMVMGITSSGALDPTFGTAGVTTVNWLVADSNEEVRGMSTQSSGKIIVFGEWSNSSMTVARFTADGAVDTSFGTGGKRDMVFPNPSANPFDGAVAPDDSLYIVGGNDVGGGRSIAVAHVLVDGTMDNGFSGDGMVYTPIGVSTDIDELYGAIVQPDGNVVVAGRLASGGANDMVFARYRPDGTLDPDFGTAGIATFAIGTSTWANDLVLHTDGTLAVGGVRDGDFFTARLSTVTVPDYVDSTTDWDTVAPNDGFFGACMSGVSGGAAATWVVDAACTTTDDPWWNAIPTTPTKIASTAAFEPDPVDATASLKFAFRAPSSQPAGQYLAPVSFEVIAPAS